MVRGAEENRGGVKQGWKERTGGGRSRANHGKETDCELQNLPLWESSLHGKQAREDPTHILALRSVIKPNGFPTSTRSHYSVKGMIL